MWITALLVGAVIALLVKWYLDRIHKQKTFERAGIPGPKPHFVYGNWMEATKGGTRLKYLEWHKKYGKTFGFYEGAVPVLATGDVALIKQVLVKQFSSFHSRKESVFASKESIVHVKGDDWKRQRMVLSPTFSTRGIKEMSSLVNDTITKLMALLEKRAEEGKAFDVMKDFQGLTLSAIACCGFGLDVDAINNPDEIFLKKCQAVFQHQMSSLARKVFVLSFLCPSLYSLCKAMFPTHFQLPFEWFFATAKAIIESRKEKKSSRKDFIQLMILAEEQDQPRDVASLEVNIEEDTEAGKEKENKPANTTERSSKGKSMTMEEMQASCMSFLLAGFETTSTTLAFLAYELAVHTEIQDELLKEVDEHFPGDKLPDYLSVQKLPYMEMVFSETLRLHPPAQIVQTRHCFSDSTVEGIALEEGSVVQILVDAVHRDPEHWGPEDPEEFVPERFLPERKSKRDAMAWIPFGAGPRNCVGMRFAIMEVKMTLARLLKQFRIVRCDETQVPVKITSRGIARPDGGVFIKLESRV